MPALDGLGQFGVARCDVDYLVLGQYVGGAVIDDVGGVGTVGGSVSSTQPVQWPYAPWLFVRRLAECPRAPKGRPRLGDATGTPDLQRAPVWHRWPRG